MKYIEDILSLNRLLSFRTLIFNRYNRVTKFLIILPHSIAIILIGIIIFYSLSEKNLNYLWILLLVFILAILSSAHSQYSTQKIIKKHYGYALKNDKMWNYKTIYKIRKQELIKILDNKDLLKKDNLIFLIESVKYHGKSEHKFNFLWHTVIILVSVYLGGFLSSQTAYYKDFEQFESHYKDVAIALGIIILVAWITDYRMIKDIIYQKKISNNMLLRTLENVYIEKYAT